MLQDWLNNFRDVTDLNAQIEMAYWAKNMYYATLISIAVGVAGFGGLVLSLLQTGRAINDNHVTSADARELGKAQARAYLHVTGIVCTDGAVLAKVSNTGETPSPVYFVGCEAKRIPLGQISSSLKLGDYRMKSWQALPAKTELPARVEVTNGAELLHQNLHHTVGIYEWGEADRLVITGTVIYEDIFGEMFQTAFAFYAPNSMGKFLKPTHMLPAYMPHPSPYPIALTGEDT